MSRIVKFDLAGGGAVLVETRDLTPSGQVVRGGVTDTVVKAAHSFEDAIGVIQPVALSLLTKLKEAGQRPDTVDIKFGLKFTAEAGAIIASASTEANIEVSIGWRHPQESA